MRKFAPYIICAVLAAAVAFTVGYFMSHSNIVLRIAHGEKREWTKHHTGGKFLKGNPRTYHGSKWSQSWSSDSKRVEDAIVKLTIAREKGLLSEEEYEKIVLLLIDPMLGTGEVEVSIDIKTRVIQPDSDSDEHDSDQDDGDE